MTRNQLVLWSIALCWVPLVAGCGRSLPSTVRVSGKVTYRGKPVPHGTVSFLPLRLAEGDSPQPATGDIQPDGTYEMNTFSRGDGVRPGEYGVAVVSYKGGKTDWVPPLTPDKKIEYAVPEKYISPRTSGLTVTIPEGSQPIVKDFDLSE